MFEIAIIKWLPLSWIFLVTRYISPWATGYFTAKEKLVPKCKLMQDTTEAVKTGFQLLNIYRTTRTPEILKRSTILTISVFMETTVYCESWRQSMTRNDWLKFKFKTRFPSKIAYHHYQKFRLLAGVFFSIRLWDIMATIPKPGFTSTVKTANKNPIFKNPPIQEPV